MHDPPYNDYGVSYSPGYRNAEPMSHNCNDLKLPDIALDPPQASGEPVFHMDEHTLTSLPGNALAIPARPPQSKYLLPAPYHTKNADNPTHRPALMPT